MENKYNLLGVLRTLFKWKYPVLTVCGLAFLGSVIISFLLPVYFKADTIFLAASPDQAKPDLLFGKTNLEPEYYGNQSDIDRLLTLAESEELITFLIDSFDLYTHYEIDSSKERSSYYVRETLFGHYEIVKTKRDALELSIEDTDRFLAASMANAARQKIDELAQDLIKEGQYKTLKSYEINISSKEKQLKELSDSLYKLRQNYGIYNATAQSESLTEQYSQAEAKLIRERGRLKSVEGSGALPSDSIAVLRAFVNGREEEVSSLQQKLEKLNEGMADVSTLEKQYLEANQSLGEDKERYKLVMSAYQSIIPAIILVQEAKVPVIKSKPRRTILVLVSTTIAFLFSVIGVLLLDTYKDVNWREIIHAE